jgi:hypothetical protein
MACSPPSDWLDYRERLRPTFTPERPRPASAVTAEQLRDEVIAEHPPPDERDYIDDPNISAYEDALQA